MRCLQAVETRLSASFSLRHAGPFAHEAGTATEEAEESMPVLLEFPGAEALEPAASSGFAHSDFDAPGVVFPAGCFFTSQPSHLATYE